MANQGSSWYCLLCNVSLLDDDNYIVAASFLFGRAVFVFLPDTN